MQIENHIDVEFEKVSEKSFAMQIETWLLMHGNILAQAKKEVCKRTDVYFRHCTAVE